MKSHSPSKPNFEKLHVYRLSENLADRVWDIVFGWDRFARDTVGAQVVRAADSIGANIAEGVGRGSHPDNRRFVRTARGSLNEQFTFCGARSGGDSLLRHKQKLSSRFSMNCPRGLMPT